jgi:hypothetical protein
MTMQGRYPDDPIPKDAYEDVISPTIAQGPGHGLMGRNADFLQRPTPMEPQTTSGDVAYSTQLMLEQYLGDIRRELIKSNPDILTMTSVQGPNPIISTATDLQVRTLKFLSGGKPITVYKTYLWTNSAKAVRASFNGLSSGADGFVIPSSPQVLDVPISEIQIALNVAGTIGVNLPSGIAADGSVFVFGFAIPEYVNRRDYGEGTL